MRNVIVGELSDSIAGGMEQGTYGLTTQSLAPTASAPLRPLPHESRGVLRRRRIWTLRVQAGGTCGEAADERFAFKAVPLSE